MSDYFLLIRTNTDHVPDVVGKPVDDAVETTDDLKMLGFDCSFIDEKHDERRRNERHRTDCKDRNQHVRSLLTESTHSHYMFICQTKTQTQLVKIRLHRNAHACNSENVIRVC